MGEIRQSGNLLIQGNYADFGGGIMLFRAGGPTFANTAVQNNTAQNGGGMGIYWSEVTVERSTFYENSANYGGGLAITKGSNAIFTNISVFNNSGNYGGGLFLIDSNMSLIHATIVSNLASSGDNAYLLHAGQFEIKNSIIWGSSPENTLANWNTSITASFCDIRQPEGTVIPGEGNINADPRLGEPGDYGGFTQTIPLLPGSPAVDAVPLDQCTLADGVHP